MGRGEKRDKTDTPPKKLQKKEQNKTFFFEKMTVASLQIGGATDCFTPFKGNSLAETLKTPPQKILWLFFFFGGGGIFGRSKQKKTKRLGSSSHLFLAVLMSSSSSSSCSLSN